MSEIILFVADFRLGTKITEALADLNQPVKFADGERFGLSDVDENTEMIIIDLDDSVFQTVAFVSGLRSMNKDLRIIGYMKTIHKETYERLKSAGCNVILPKSSFVKNIRTLVSE